MTMAPNRLWAKSKHDGDEEHPSMFLPQHLKDVYAAAERVLDATGDAQLDALKLTPATHFDRLRRCVLLAAAVHDLGKANDHFQGMICRVPDRVNRPQGVRHEWVTVLMLQELKPWLMPAVADETEFALVEWAVSGHHPAHNHPSPPRTCPPGAGAEMRLRTNEGDFAACLDCLRKTFNLSDAVPKLAKTVWPMTGFGNPFSEFLTWFKAAQRRWESVRKNAENARLLAAVKDCLIAADVAGSALPKEDPHNSDRWEWITQSFGKVPSGDDLTFLANYSLDGNDPRPFQTAVAETPDEVVFVKAGCGSGKTVAAYMRAAKQWAGRRLYFCYPTTGTATEGFKDYLHPELPEKAEDDTLAKKAERERLKQLNADLFHSRRAVDFEIILGTDADSSTAAADAAVRVESLDAWSTPIVACTVDTVLGIVQNNKRGLFAWPALAQSAFVFDEIHAYDDRLFGALLRFLRDLPGLPALLMTASLPKPREEALRDVLKEFRGIDLKPITGPKDLEERPRYKKATVANTDPLPMIETELQAGGKVLWVCNTVNRVMAAAERAKHLAPLIYHSRFKYVQRVERHKQVVESFRPESTKAVLAITSQVCEMSLDLRGCTLLVTDNAPVPSLIQRLGRLNRAAKAGDPTRPFVVLEPDGHLPYTPAELDAAKAWLAKLPDDAINQLHLVRAWEQSAENPPDLVPSAWLDGGPITTVTELREASPGITVVMKCDALPMLVYKARVAKELRRAREERRKLDSTIFAVGQGERHPRDVGRFTIPMPQPHKKLDWKDGPKLNGIPIVEDASIVYDAKRGAEWQKQ